MSSKPVCIRCGKPGPLTCSKCKQVNYCSRECQLTHWKTGHKGECGVLTTSQTKHFIDSAVPETNLMGSTEALTNKFEKLSTKETIRKDDVSVSDYLMPPKRVQQMMNFKPTNISFGTGLYNAGNTCYINSVLQVLSYTRPLANYLLSMDHSKSCKNQAKFCMLCTLEHHTRVMLYNDLQYHVPREILLNLSQIGDFRLFVQEDAHDFLYSVLNGAQKSIIANIPLKIPMKIEETSLIYQIFGGYIQSLVKCAMCEHVSANFESFLDLSLELSSGASVEEALEQYTNIERLDESVGWRCEKCAKAVPAHKQLTVFQSPNILTITLKRFDLLRGGGKINKTIVYRENLSLKRVMSPNSEDTLTDYELYAVIVHYGPTVFGGHYICFVKFDDVWYLFDDTKVKEVSAAVVLKQNAYMLFYQKKVQVENSAMKSKMRVIEKESNPLISSESTQSAQQTAGEQQPNYKIYEREEKKENANFIQDFVVVIDVPLLMSTHLSSGMLQMNSNGRINFQVKKFYALDLMIPFQMSLEKCRAVFYKREGQIVVIAAVSHTKIGNDQMQTLPIEETANSIAEMELAKEHEFVLEETKTAKRQDSNVEEATYSKLYKDIMTTSANASIKTATSSNAAAKIGRNDNCPCGSGKKYKKCHGSN